VLSLAVKHPGVRSLINPRQTSAITYVQSPLNVADGDGFGAGPVPGAVLAEFPLTIAEGGHAREAHLTDLVGARFTALCFSDEGEVSADFTALAQAMRERGVPFKVVSISAHLRAEARGVHAWDHTGRIFGRYDAKPGTVYLVRPDGHVLGRWRNARADDVDAAITRALAR
jgi:3-(3-hydroxy-phenyl)propionate hydroxylase